MQTNFTFQLILVFFTFPIFLQAQVPFPTTNAQWCYSGYGDMGEDLGLFCFEPGESVEVDGKTYTEIEYQDLPFSGPQTILYREENGRFYVLPQDSLEEKLVYDFNLEVADTFYAEWGWAQNEPITLVVTDIEIVNTLEGADRKKLTLSGDSGFGTWLEGIGSLEWVFVLPAYIPTISGGFTFACFSEGGFPIYPEFAQADDCGLLDNTEELNQAVTIRTYPNPARELLNITTDNFQATSITVTDLLGQTILAEQPNQLTHFSINVSTLPKGVYFLKVEQKGQGAIIKSFVKE